MAELSGRSRMISSIEGLTEGRCREAVLIQQRPRWAIAATAVVAATLGIPLFASGMPAALAGGITGAIAGVGVVLLSKMWILARVGEDIVLATSSKLWAKATSIVWRAPAPVAWQWDGGRLIRRLALGEETYLVSRAFATRTEAILN